MAKIEEQIEKMYAANLASQTERLEQDRAKAEADLVAQQEKAQKAMDANLTRTAVEAQKAAVNNAELHNAAGLSSGARAQARLAQENQLQADLTALRVQQQATDAEAERQRGLLAQEFASAIREAQAENDLAKAQALYEQAQLEEERLLAQQSGGSGASSADDMITAGKLIAQETGDYTMWAEGMRLKGVNITEEQLRALNGDTDPVMSPGDIASQNAAIVNKYAPTYPDTKTGNLFNRTIAAVNAANNRERFGLKIVDTDAVKTFKGSVMTQNEHRRRGEEGTYQDYLEDAISKWVDSGKLNDDEGFTLMTYYGLLNI